MACLPHSVVSCVWDGRLQPQMRLDSALLWRPGPSASPRCCAAGPHHACPVRGRLRHAAHRRLATIASILLFKMGSNVMLPLEHCPHTWTWLLTVHWLLQVTSSTGAALSPRATSPGGFRPTASRRSRATAARRVVEGYIAPWVGGRLLEHVGLAKRTRNDGLPHGHGCASYVH